MKWIDSFIDILNKIDGLSKKTSERLFFDCVKNKEKTTELIKVLNNINKNIELCEICFFIKQNDSCEICKNNSDKNKIFVVSSLSDGFTLLKNKSFDGNIHVIHGEININKNIAPDNLKIKELFDRINKESELILVLNLTFEGELTSNYIINELKKTNIKVTKIARGIPMGGVVDFIDPETLEEAIKNRRIT